MGLGKRENRESSTSGLPENGVCVRAGCGGGGGGGTGQALEPWRWRCNTRRPSWNRKSPGSWAEARARGPPPGRDLGPLEERPTCPPRTAPLAAQRNSSVSVRKTSAIERTSLANLTINLSDYSPKWKRVKLTNMAWVISSWDIIVM